MLFLRGAIVKTGTHGGACAAEMGEGRRLQLPIPPTNPRAKRLSMSPDDLKSEEEGVPTRGTSAPPFFLQPDWCYVFQEDRLRMER